MVRKDKYVTPSVTQKLQDLGYKVADWDDSSTRISQEVKQVLSSASKKQNDNAGYPDRIYCNKTKKLLILVEEKPDIKSHDIPNIEK
ncbi:MAG: hypothetical protein LBO09_08140 [Candidatus Peribacteria bacterium]|jgi:hypothetical protein|nr:hypothetical protein [Candidatus Peribacteria bacterium]